MTTNQLVDKATYRHVTRNYTTVFPQVVHHVKRSGVSLRNVRPVCNSVHMSRMVSPDEAAAHLGISTRTVHRRIKDGTIPAYRLGPRLLRIDLDDLVVTRTDGDAA